MGRPLRAHTQPALATIRATHPGTAIVDSPAGGGRQVIGRIRQTAAMPDHPRSLDETGPWRRMAAKVIVMLAIAIGVAGCGDAATPRSHPVAGALRAADRVCATFNASVGAQSPPIGLSALQAYGRRQLRLRAHELSGLRALEGRFHSAAYRAYLDHLAEEHRLLVHALTDRVTPPSTRRGANLAASVARDTAALGLRQCRRDPYGEPRTSSSSLPTVTGPSP